MNERHIPDVHVFADAHFLELNTVADTALSQVEASYGSGYPHFTSGEQGGLAYHNRHHSAAVQQGSEAMADALGLSLAERALASTAAAAHDIVQLKSRGIMEQESADWLVEQLRRNRLFSESAVRAGALAILGTEPIFEGNAIVGQVAGTQAYPSKSAEQIAMSVACADLGELYAPTGPLAGHLLYKEIKGVAPGDDISLEGLVGFQRGQVALTESYQFPHPTGQTVFGGLKSEVVAYSAHVLDQLERGQLEHWDQLIAQDEAFMRMHSA
jgi:hypothetical protein